jgi:hypothetical protein
MQGWRPPVAQTTQVTEERGVIGEGEGDGEGDGEGGQGAKEMAREGEAREGEARAVGAISGVGDEEEGVEGKDERAVEAGEEAELGGKGEGGGKKEEEEQKEADDEQDHPLKVAIKGWTWSFGLWGLELMVEVLWSYGTDERIELGVVVPLHSSPTAPSPSPSLSLPLPLSCSP